MSILGHEDALPTGLQNVDFEVHYESSSGTFVKRQVGHSANEEELQIARFLADEGSDILLQNKSEALGQKTADAWVRQSVSEIWESWEFKTITDRASNFQNAAQKAFLEGRKQAPTVLLWMNRSHKEDVDVSSVNRSMKPIFFNDVNHVLQHIVLMNRNGQIQLLEMNEVINGKRFRVF